MAFNQSVTLPLNPFSFAHFIVFRFFFADRSIMGLVSRITLSLPKTSPELSWPASLSRSRARIAWTMSSHFRPANSWALRSGVISTLKTMSLWAGWLDGKCFRSRTSCKSFLLSLFTRCLFFLWNLIFFLFTITLTLPNAQKKIRSWMSSFTCEMSDGLFVYASFLASTRRAASRRNTFGRSIGKSSSVSGVAAKLVLSRFVVIKVDRRKKKKKSFRSTHLSH